MLRRNIFEYDGELYGQDMGTSIGALFVCAYSGVAMANVEEEGLRKWVERDGGKGGNKEIVERG